VILKEPHFYFKIKLATAEDIARSTVKTTMYGDMKTRRMRPAEVITCKPSLKKLRLAKLEKKEKMLKAELEFIDR